MKVTITHPFSPMKGREYLLIEKKVCWGQVRVLVFDENGDYRRFPASWTDLADPDPLSAVTDEHARRKVLNNIHAIEGFVLFACIAMGILQLASLSDGFAEAVIKKRYLRTPSNKNPSEDSVMYYLRKSFFLLLLNAPDSAITRIIRSRQDQPQGEELSKSG